MATDESLKVSAEMGTTVVSTALLKSNAIFKVSSVGIVSSLGLIKTSKLTIASGEKKSLLKDFLTENATSTKIINTPITSQA